MAPRQDAFLATVAKVAGIGLCAGGLFALCAFAYFFYQYTWTGQRQFSSVAYGVLYYGLPLAVAVLLFASLRFGPQQRVNFFLALTSTTGTIYAIELFAESRYASVFASTRPVMMLLLESTDRTRAASALADRWHVPIDARTADEVIAALRKDSANAVPIITPSNHLFIRQPDGSIESAIRVDGKEVMPLAGVSDRLTLMCNENGQWLAYRSDAHGFNNADDVWKLERLDIALLGDSFAHGYCVDGRDTFAALIRQRHPATINLAIAGDGPLLMLATLTEYLAPARPNHVLWFYFEGNDLTDLQVERRSALLSSYMSDGFTQRPPFDRQRDIDDSMLAQIPRLEAIEEENRQRREKNRLANKLSEFARLTTIREKLGLVGGMESGAREIGEDLETANMKAFADVLRKAKQRVATWGGDLVFVYLPEWARYTNYDSWGKSQRSRVLALVTDLAIPIIDLDPAFKDTGDPLSLFPFRAQGHYNAAGHRVVAQAILKRLDASVPSQ